jgi:histidinol-phosphate phosphatase family protein
MRASFDIVVPTVGRPSLGALLNALALSDGPRPGKIVVVQDGSSALVDTPEGLEGRIEVLRGAGRGPAAARNTGWRASRAKWVIFLDDDVVPSRGWLEGLERDLAGLGPDVAASQGRLRVPLPPDRRPTDWERNVKALELAQWVTADLAVRRDALAAVNGFDERFRRAYREDADLALRLIGAGYRIVRGRRTVTHPVRPEGSLASIRLQAGNADDALMDALHGSDWRERVGAARGRRPIHFVTSVLGAGGIVLLLVRRRAGLLALAGWLGATLELAWRRIAPGPRSAREIAAMLVTSFVIPPAATLHWFAGRVRARRLLRAAARPNGKPRAVLFDRDGTLIVNVPYNGDPDLVVPMPGARAALDRLRDAGLALAVISNQSGVARGLMTSGDVDRVATRVEDLLGPLGTWMVCTHGPDDGCRCRKPAPGLILQAAEALGVDPADCVVIGDIGADVEAAKAAGARAILVPTEATRREEVDAAPEVARDLERAVDLVLGGAP